MHTLAEATVPDVAPGLYRSTKKSDFKPDWRYTGGMLQVIEHKAVLNLLDRLFNISWSSMGSSGLFQELSKVFALKIFDEKNTEAGQPYCVQRKKGESDDELYARLNEHYFDSVAGILSGNNIEMRPYGFGQIIDKIAPIYLSVSCPDILGLAYGTYISWHSRSTLGQFFTPAQVCDFVVELLDPEPGAKILDPACGSGSFLASAYNYMTRGKDLSEKVYRIPSSFVPGDEEVSRPRENLFGIEISHQLAGIARANLYSHGAHPGNIYCGDSLESMETLADMSPDLAENSFDYIIGNPPYGVKWTRDLKEYELAYSTNKKGYVKIRTSVASEVLFLERCIKLLKPGGVMALVVNDGLLANSKMQYVRKYLMERCQVRASISLPAETFTPWGTSIKTSVLIVRKLVPGEDAGNYMVFMAAASKIGYDRRGNPNASDLPEILEAWRGGWESTEVEGEPCE